MTMIFRQVKTKLVEGLEAASGGQYRTLGYQDQGKAAEALVDNNRSVQVFYQSGTFSKTSGGRAGPITHEMSFKLELSVGGIATGDLATIDDPNSSDLQRSAAIAAFKHATAQADEKLDELIDIVFQIMMNVELRFAGLSRGLVANTWIDRIEKSEPIQMGQHVALIANMDFTLRASETVSGDTGDPADEPAVIVDFKVVKKDSETTPDTAPAGVVGGD
jgi:hypothetical protein